jgi:hypothetical protein
MVIRHAALLLRRHGSIVSNTRDLILRRAAGLSKESSSGVFPVPVGLSFETNGFAIPSG